MNWEEFDGGSSIGQTGSEGGSVVLDDEYGATARISLERDCRSSPFAITCGVYGWMVHTRFFAEESEAKDAFNQMKSSLKEIVDSLPDAEPEPSEEEMDKTSSKISEFVDRFP